MQKGYPAMGPFERGGPPATEILTALMRAHHDLALLCAAATRANYMPEVRRLPGLQALHKANYEAAYHLTSAIGAAHMIMAGAREPSYYAVLVNCQRKAAEALQRAADAHRQMAAAIGQAHRPLGQQIGGHIQGALGNLQRAYGITTAVLGQETIQRLMEMDRQAAGSE
jgi:hypothetical protein